MGRLIWKVFAVWGLGMLGTCLLFVAMFGMLMLLAAAGTAAGWFDKNIVHGREMQLKVRWLGEVKPDRLNADQGDCVMFDERDVYGQIASCWLPAGVRQLTLRCKDRKVEARMPVVAVAKTVNGVVYYRPCDVTDAEISASNHVATVSQGTRWGKEY